MSLKQRGGAVAGISILLVSCSAVIKGEGSGGKNGASEAGEATEETTTETAPGPAPAPGPASGPSPSVEAATITGVTPLAAKAGDELTVSGTNFRAGQNAVVEGVATALQVTEAKTSFLMPAGVRAGLVTMKIKDATTESAAFALMSSPADGMPPVALLDAAQVCSDVQFRDASGAVKNGMRACSGSGVMAPGTCVSDGASGCVVDGTTYKAVSASLLVPGNVKKGVVLAGVTGDYEGPGGGGMGGGGNAWDVRAGANVGGVIGKLKTSCRNGMNRTFYDIGRPRPVAIDDGTDVFALTGHGFQDGDRALVAGHPVPAGVSSSISYYVDVLDADTFKLSSTDLGTPTYADATTTGTDVVVYQHNDGVIGPYDNIDDYVNDSTDAGALVTEGPWNAGVFCGGVDTAGSNADDDNVWLDTTVMGCNSTFCRMQDKITKVEWTKVLTRKSWGIGAETCENLVYDGKSDWRLPTQKELLEAYTHGIRTAASADWITLANFREASFLSSTTASRANARVWLVNLASGTSTFTFHYDLTSGSGFTLNARLDSWGNVACVRRD